MGLQVAQSVERRTHGGLSYLGNGKKWKIRKNIYIQTNTHTKRTKISTHVRGDGPDHVRRYNTGHGGRHVGHAEDGAREERGDVSVVDHVARESHTGHSHSPTQQSHGGHGPGTVQEGDADQTQGREEQAWQGENTHWCYASFGEDAKFLEETDLFLEEANVLEESKCFRGREFFLEEAIFFREM